MTKIEDAVARINASSADNTAALTDLIAAASKEIQQVADALTKPDPDTDALADQLNTAADALDAGVQSAKDATAQLGADDPATP